jgi:hypothetical protein
MKARRNQYKIEPLMLCDENDNVIETINVRSDYIAMRNRLLASLGDIQKLSEDHATDEAIGGAVLELMKGLYGEDGAVKIVEYFEGNYTEMITTVTQHIYEDILPAVNRLLDERRKQAKAYGRK